MKVVHNDLMLLIERFPEQVIFFEELYLSDPDFRTLCADYYLCMQILEKNEREWSEKKMTSMEFNEISRELEQEFRRYITEKSNSNKKASGK